MGKLICNKCGDFFIRNDVSEWYAENYSDIEYICEYCYDDILNYCKYEDNEDDNDDSADNEYYIKTLKKIFKINK